MGLDPSTNVFAPELLSLFGRYRLVSVKDPSGVEQSLQMLFRAISPGHGVMIDQRAVVRYFQETEYQVSSRGLLDFFAGHVVTRLISRGTMLEVSVFGKLLFEEYLFPFDVWHGPLGGRARHRGGGNEKGSRRSLRVTI
jgi:hypothetical protein